MIISLVNTIHILLHFLLPVLVSFFFFPKIFWTAWALLMISMVIDLDHLFSKKIFQTGRCSIGNHILHSKEAVLTYCLLLFFPKLRLVVLGLLIHLIVDATDCIYIHWKQRFLDR